MNVWDHLSELRRRLLICVYVLLAGTLAGAFVVNPVVSWLARPVGDLVFLTPTEAFTAQIKIAVGFSVLLGLPVFLYQIWAFVSAGLQETEKRYVRWLVPVSYGLFMGGTLFSCFVVFPKAVAFLLTLKSSHLVPVLSVEAYLDFFLLLCLSFGLLFQLPLVVHFLAKLGLMKTDFLTRNRRLMYLLFFVLATLLNPVPEVFTQVLLALVAITLFELSVLLVKWEIRRKV